MADIELVIKIPEQWFDDMVREEFEDVDELCAVIQCGTPLPKKHGRLIDEREVYKKFYCRCLAKAAKEVLKEVQTIIEADKS